MSAKLGLSTILLVVAAGFGAVAADQTPSTDSTDQDAVATFRARVDLVRVSAIVRDRRGRFVDDLAARDFEVLEGDEVRPIAEFRRDFGGVSLAVLFDVSGSMEAEIASARETAGEVFGSLDPNRDEAGVLAFDTGLRQLTSFTSDLAILTPSMAAVVPFGETSLLDAMAESAGRVGTREGKRRAVIVLTDGRDNASRLSPLEVTHAASGIDVPIYIVLLVKSIDRPALVDAASPGERARPAGALTDLASQTGGRLFVASSPLERAAAARQIVEELRHEYLIAFESSGRPGWHPLVVRTRNKDLAVRARHGYIAGQSRPSSE